MQKNVKKCGNFKIKFNIRTPFKTNEIRHCCNSVSKAIWQIKLAVKDASIDEEPKHLELFICDFDGNGSVYLIKSNV
jgi:hypothetical protein